MIYANCCDLSNLSRSLMPYTVRYVESLWKTVRSEVKVRLEYIKVQESRAEEVYKVIETQCMTPSNHP